MSAGSPDQRYVTSAPTARKGNAERTTAALIYRIPAKHDTGAAAAAGQRRDVALITSSVRYIVTLTHEKTASCPKSNPASSSPSHSVCRPKSTRGRPTSRATSPAGSKSGDSAYGSGEARAAYRAAGHDTVIKPKPVQPAVPGGFTLDDFTISEQDGTVTCPAGHTRPGSGKRTVTFGALCGGCLLRARCTTAKDGRSMTIHPQRGCCAPPARRPVRRSSGRPTRPGR